MFVLYSWNAHLRSATPLSGKVHKGSLRLLHYIIVWCWAMLSIRFTNTIPRCQCSRFIRATQRMDFCSVQAWCTPSFGS
ncbi:hypothetical protein OBBRIDRAFT_792992 [Obba rivulosa]|uniref:Uncharacterized protein n=1 Tax=Obba rivulosa TaxID=1052685 RepID=A0A8E2DL83_9APHY|nr:hypothetical protein OBBRIDRAFT_792992 [Obba rivulosa]